MKYIKPINENFDHLSKDEIIHRLERLITIVYEKLSGQVSFPNLYKFLLDEGIKEARFVKINDGGWAIDGLYYVAVKQSILVNQSWDEPVYFPDIKELKHFDKNILIKILELLSKEERISRILNQEMFKKLNK